MKQMSPNVLICPNNKYLKPDDKKAAQATRILRGVETKLKKKKFKRKNRKLEKKKAGYSFGGDLIDTLGTRAKKKRKHSHKKKHVKNFSKSNRRKTCGKKTCKRKKKTSKIPAKKKGRK